MAKKKVVRIECRGAESFPIEKFSDFQGGLKRLPEKNFEKLKKEIVERGFSQPICIWQNNKKNYILDGHQRLRVLKMLMVEGWDVPDIPVVYVEAEDLKEAKHKLLSFASQYGKIDGEGLYGFMNEFDFSLQEVSNAFELPELRIDKFEKEFFVDPMTEESEEEDLEEDAEMQFIVAVHCKDEKEMQKIFKEMRDRNLECKLIT